jgi:ubiquinone/menaquinone biosynthesis C-methylase UbiE
MASSTAWDRIAHVYDWQLPLERRAVAAALDLAAPRSEDHLLDVATGTGAVLRILARREVRPAVVVGVDRSAGMLNHVPPLPGGWTLKQADATEMQFPPASFDVVVASYVLHLLDPPGVERALGEMRRMLKPGGRVVTVTPLAPRSRLRALYRLIVAALGLISAHALGLRPMDPRPALARSGLPPVKGRYVHSGYPSLCVLARASQAPGRTGVY